MAACLLIECISSIVVISCEHARIFNTEEARDGQETDERQQSEKMKGTELCSSAKHCGARNPSPCILAFANKHYI